jgi:hypothetical protein
LIRFASGKPSSAILLLARVSWNLEIIAAAIYVRLRQEGVLLLGASLEIAIFYQIVLCIRELAVEIQLWIDYLYRESLGTTFGV